MSGKTHQGKTLIFCSQQINCASLENFCPTEDLQEAVVLPVTIYTPIFLWVYQKLPRIVLSLSFMEIGCFSLGP